METNKPVKFEIAASQLGGFDILVTFGDGTQASWGKRIKTERGAKARMSMMMKRFGLGRAA